MFDVDTFIDSCESYMITEIDYDIAEEGLRFEAFKEKIKNIGEKLIEALRRFRVWLTGLFGKYNGYYYEEGVRILAPEYSNLFITIRNAGSKAAKYIQKTLRLNKSMRGAVIDFSLPELNGYSDGSKIDEINHKIFVAVDSARKKGAKPIKITEMEDLKKMVEKYKGVFKEFEDECRAVMQKYNPNEDEEYINKALRPILNAFAKSQSGFMTALNKCTYRGRKDVQQSEVDFSDLKFN